VNLMRTSRPERPSEWIIEETPRTFTGTINASRAWACYAAHFESWSLYRGSTSTSASLPRQCLTLWVRRKGKHE